jgi:general secretion pathway protein A
MYAHFFGLKRDPFAMTPDPDLLHMTIGQREAMAGIVYAILARKGFVALIGEAGTGKTTLLNKLMRTLKQEAAQFSVVFNPTLSPSEFMESALADFGVSHIPVSKSQRLTLLHQLLLRADSRGATSVLIVDEAHKLSVDVLEEIRLLSNFERPGAKLLQIVLAGQPELADLLDRQDLEQLKQRIAIRLKMNRFSPAELHAYIAHRWTAAGGSEHPFSAGALALITKYSKGIARVVNSLCDNALMLALAEGVTAVTEAHVQEAASDLSFLDNSNVPVASAAGMSNGASGIKDHPGASAGIPEQSSTKQAPAVTDLVDDPTPIPCLERYGERRGNGSVVGRLLERLGLAS